FPRFGPGPLELLGETWFGGAHGSSQVLREKRNSEFLDHPAQLRQLGMRRAARGASLEILQCRGKRTHVRGQLLVAPRPRGESSEPACDRLHVTRQVAQPRVRRRFYEVRR